MHIAVDDREAALRRPAGPVVGVGFEGGRQRASSIMRASKTGIGGERIVDQDLLAQRRRGPAGSISSPSNCQCGKSVENSSMSSD
jgi:hypothetical protein